MAAIWGLPVTFSIHRQIERDRKVIGRLQDRLAQVGRAGDGRVVERMPDAPVGRARRQIRRDHDEIKQRLEIAL